LPRTALAIAVAAFLWAGLPGTFSLAVRWSLWQSGATSPLVLVAVAGGALLRVLAVARLVAMLYFRAPSGALETPLAPHWYERGRWGVVFVAALLIEVALALGTQPWAERLLTIQPVLYGG
jgi:formate hydrogenlyase subunit 3/multisubunit Na+/H+ antiporter MnhD subunit